MSDRWVATYAFRWTPIVTFARRRLALLDWYEGEIDPVAIAEGSESLGVALMVPDLRLEISRRGMILSSGLHRGDIEHLQVPLRGVFEVLEPRDVVLTTSAHTFTHDLGDDDYNEARARFAARCSFATPTSTGGFRAVDASALVDVEAPDATIQVEWGVVEADELLLRLEAPDMGRLDRGSLGRAPSLPPGLSDELPQVSLLVDLHSQRKIGGEAADGSSVLKVAKTTEEQMAALVDALQQSFASGRTS